MAQFIFNMGKMLRSITDDNGAAVLKAANELGIERKQVIQIVANPNGTVTLYYNE